MSEAPDKPSPSRWPGVINLLIGAALLIRHGMTVLSLMKTVHAGHITPRGALIAGCFHGLYLILGILSVATGSAQLAARRWAPVLAAVTGGAILMNAGYRLVVFGYGSEVGARSLVAFGPDLVLAAWWIYGLRRGPWRPALVGAAGGWLADQAINVWLSQTRF